MRPVFFTQVLKITALMILLSGLVNCPKTIEKNGTADQNNADQNNADQNNADQTQREEINIISNTELEKYVEYVPDKGYCVEKHDEDGCNICSLAYVNKIWVLDCTNNFCWWGNKEKANQCNKYLSKEELLKKIASTKQSLEEENQTTDGEENTPPEEISNSETEQRLVLYVRNVKDAARAAKNTLCGGIMKIKEDQNGEGYWVSVKKSSDSIVKIFIKKSSVIPENNCESWCDNQWLRRAPWCG